MSFSVLRKLSVSAAILVFSVSAMAQNSGFDLGRIDRSAAACDDFWQFANGTWDKNTEIPADRSRFGSFDQLADNNRTVLRAIVDENSAAGAKFKTGSDEQLIGDFYSSCMDEAAIETAGATPLDPFFKQINSVSDQKSLIKAIAFLHNHGFPAVFGFGAGPDLKNSTMGIANTSQGGLSLPNRDYYTKDDDKSKQTRAQFVAHIAKMFELLGDNADAAKTNAETVLRLQTRLAQASKAPVELRNPESRYNKISRAEAQKLAPNLDWNLYLKERNAPKFDEINVGQPEFLKVVNTMLTDTPTAEWKTYLRWMVVNSSAPRLAKKFEEENFNFFSKTLSGVKEQQPRWRRCVGATDNTVGEALGQAYIKKAFSPEAKSRMDALITNLFTAFKGRITQLDWMSEPTKQEALAKLATFKRKIGYPDKLRGYKNLEIKRGSHYQNLVNAAKFEVARNLKDIGQPTDRDRWGFTTPTVNASYSPTQNAITFPAGILQPPFFNFKADDAINYGGIGAVIGHEITHGFDDQGSKFDAQGNYRMWWTADDRKRFEAKSDCVVKQFAGYEVIPGTFMNGNLTLGENIADLGGLTVAFEAYQKAIAAKRPADIDGFTPEQRFFLGYAQIWSTKARPEAVLLQVKTDPHALPRWRVNGPLANLPIFAETFGCKTGEKMVRQEQCQIW